MNANPEKKPKRKRKSRYQPITAYNSKPKMIIYAGLCLLAAGVAFHAVVTGTDPLGGGPIMHSVAGGLCVLMAFVLLQMGFDREPVLVIDDEGIFCRRPNVGLIPWRAVIGLGTSKPTLFRRVLMVAVDREELDEKALKHVKFRRGLFSAFSPRVERFEGQMKGHPSVHIPISDFSVSVAEFERELADKIKFHGK